ncbi:MAG: sigma-54-dependent Fis family transcriptional regulator [Candidatus Aminicenantes bacterium]|nr:sigma-54-dependent Fis family transcriptional regulator [Candidatus Aminicenantes bacterium]
MKNEAQILVIDDEKDVCDLFKKALTPEGYLVSTALDGGSGLKVVKEKKPDIVLLDLKMPKMNGIEVLREIKKIDKNIVVIVITGYGTMDTARMAMTFGAFDYITKPVDLEYLKAIIKDGLKLTLRAFGDRMKEKEILKSLRSRQKIFAKIKQCKGTRSCLWEVALRSFVLGDDSFMAEWMEDPEISKEEKLDLIRIAEVLKADMGKR